MQVAQISATCLSNRQGHKHCITCTAVSSSLKYRGTWHMHQANTYSGNGRLEEKDLPQIDPTEQSLLLADSTKEGIDRVKRLSIRYSRGSMRMAALRTAL